MIIYLIKVTLIWSLLLGLFQLLYRKSPAFMMNRMYLFMALAAGLLLPLVVWNMPWATSYAAGVNNINSNIQNLEATALPAGQNTVEAPVPANVYTWLVWLYTGGVIVAALLSFREIVIILRTAIYGQFKTIDGHRIFISKKNHAPFSFMGWIFISRPEQYTEEELGYILKHEDAHNSRKHWLDMILVQLAFIVFWFHPLVWYFRYLLKLTHEYEADQVAANNNVYDYGHFLLEQTLLKGTPSIAHSFHFSPIKNRITMLTQKRTSKAWKYAIVIPALLTCTLLFAKSASDSQRVRRGDVTTYKGHRFLWGKDMFDSMQVEHATTGELTWVVSHQPGRIVRMDNDSVHEQNEPGIRKAAFRYKGKDFYEYVGKTFTEQFSGFPDSIRSINVKNMVIDDKGKVVYYDLSFRGASWKEFDLASAGSPYAEYAKVLEKIIDESPDWTPAMGNGAPIKVTVVDGFNVYFKPMKARRVAPAAK